MVRLQYHVPLVVLYRCSGIGAVILPKDIP